MSYSYTKRPFWIAGTPLGITIGDYVLRMMSQPSIYVDGTAIDAATSPKRRGATTAANVINRSMWVAPRSPSEDIIAFGAAVAAAAEPALILSDWQSMYPGFSWGSIDGYTPEGYVTHNMLERIPTGPQSLVGFKYGLRQGEVFSNTQSYWYYGRCEAAPVQNPATALDRSAVLEANLALASRKAGGRFFSDRVPTLSNPACLGEVVLSARAASQESGAADIVMDPRSFQRSWKTYIDVLNGRPRSRIYGASYDMPYGNAGVNYIGGFEVFRDYGPDVESALAAKVRTALGLSASFGDGSFEIVPVKGASMVKGAPVIGVHSAVKVLGVSSTAPDEAKWLYAEFTKDQMVATLVAQKAVCDAAAAATLDAACASITSMAVGSTFRVLYVPAGVGPLDIYDSAQIATALADGAEVSDVDASPIGSSTLGALRVAAKARPATRILSWWEQPQTNELRHVGVSPRATAPFYTLSNQGPAGGVGVCSAAEIRGTRLDNAGATAAYVDDSALIRAIEVDAGISILNAEGVKRVGQVQAQALLSPWEDLPGAWLRYCASPGWTPIANALMAAVLEPKSLFKD